MEEDFKSLFLKRLEISLEEGKIMGKQKVGQKKKKQETLTVRVDNLESVLENIQDHLKKIDSGLKSYRQHSKGVERKVSTVIVDLKKRMEGEAESESGADNCITLEEGCAVNLEDLEKNMVEKYSNLAFKDREFQDLLIKISSEMEQLHAQNKEKNLFIEAKEEELKNFKQSMTERIEVLERKLKIQRPRSSKENRWASFLAEIGKSHNS